MVVAQRGVAVSDLPRAVSWFDRLLGDVKSFEPNDTERVWTLGEHGHVYAELLPEHAGHSMVTLFVSDFGYLQDLYRIVNFQDPSILEALEPGTPFPPSLLEVG